MPRLENWFVMPIATDPYKAPEQVGRSLCGEVYEDDRFRDGHMVRTSKIASLSIADKKATTKSGTEYSLGQPQSNWIKWLSEQGFNLSDFNKE